MYSYPSGIKGARLTEILLQRRRTQIRLAQRAYRLRKETTITSLKQQTATLTSIINDMHAAFFEFSNKVTAAESNAGLATELAETQRIFVQLKERALAIGEEDAIDSPEKNVKAESEASPGSHTSDGQSPSKKLKRCSLDDLPTISTAAERGVPSVWGYEMIYEGSDNSSTQDKTDVQMAASDDENQPTADFWTELSNSMQMDIDLQTPRALGNPMQTQGVLALSNFPSQSDPGVGIRSPSSFAWQESSFARQLQRATLEAGVRLIQRRFLAPERFNKKFQMCLPFGDSDHILSKIKATLLRDQSEPLDWTDHPMRHLGGAGTHYTRRGESGDNSPANAPMPATGALGPSELAELMNSANESNNDGRTLNIAGFEGEWFDAKDVEGYLEQKGIHFEPGSCFAVMDSASILTNGGKPSPTGPSLDSLDYFSMTQGVSNRISRQSSRKDERNTQTQLLPWDAISMGALGPPTSILMGTDDMPSGVSQEGFAATDKVLIDVQKLVRGEIEYTLAPFGTTLMAAAELVKYATCIGRSPGYRRRDVDKAFKVAVSLVG